MELGVERPDLDVAELTEELGETGVVADDGGGGAAQVEVPPVSIGRPASIQAMVPPATLTASMP